MKLTRRLACLLGALALLPTLAVAETTSATREVGAFNAVAVGRGSFDVTLRAADRESVVLRGEAADLALVETTVKSSRDGRNLQVEVRRGATLSTSARIVVEIGYVRIDAIALGGDGRLRASSLRAPRLEVALGGSGSVALPGLDADVLHLAVGGSGRVEADGRAGKVEVALGGSGSVQAARLAANDVEVSIGGSGDVHVRAEKSLEVAIAGSGNVYHGGAATPVLSIVGSGRVKKAS